MEPSSTFWNRSRLKPRPISKCLWWFHSSSSNIQKIVLGVTDIVLWILIQVSTKASTYIKIPRTISVTPRPILFIFHSFLILTVLYHIILNWVDLFGTHQRMQKVQSFIFIQLIRHCRAKSLREIWWKVKVRTVPNEDMQHFAQRNYSKLWLCFYSSLKQEAQQMVNLFS